MLAHVQQDVLTIGQAPHDVACNHVVTAVRGDHHARLQIATRCLRVHDVADFLRHVPERDGFKGDAACQPSPPAGCYRTDSLLAMLLPHHLWARATSIARRN